jgi:hypothetical protein
VNILQLAQSIETDYPVDAKKTVHLCRANMAIELSDTNLPYLEYDNVSKKSNGTLDWSIPEKTGIVMCRFRAVTLTDENIARNMMDIAFSYFYDDETTCCLTSSGNQLLNNYWNSEHPCSTEYDSVWQHIIDALVVQKTAIRDSIKRVDLKSDDPQMPIAGLVTAWCKDGQGGLKFKQLRVECVYGAQGWEISVTGEIARG